MGNTKPHKPIRFSEEDGKEVLRRIYAECARTDRGCLEYLGSAGPGNGYKTVTYKGTKYLVHRLVYALEVQDPGDRMVLHTCDNRPCCERLHLFPGDAEINGADAAMKGRMSGWTRHFETHPRSSLGEKNPMAKLTEEKVQEMRKKYAEGGVTHRQLAKEYGVSKMVVTWTLNRKLWTHVE